MRKIFKGFTLIELLVVIAIIALLMAVVIPSLNKAKEAAKLVICANNQRQALLGIQTYSSDNDGKLPPHPADRNGKGNNYSVINYFNYYRHLETINPGRPKGLNYYVGGYLPLVDVFVCPLGRSKDISELQWQYENYTDHFATGADGSHTSYNLYWGGYPITTADGMKFIGPKGTGNKKAGGLVLSDTIYDWQGVDADWWLAHEPRKGSGQFLDYDSDPRYSNFVATFWIYIPTSTLLDNGLPAELEEMKMNAAYIDGSVSKYRGSEIKKSAGGAYYIPSKWR